MWFPLFFFCTLLSVCLSVWLRSAPLHCSPLLVDLPEIKGNHRKFRTLVTSYIGRYWIVGFYFSCMSVVVPLLQWLNFMSYITCSEAFIFVGKYNADMHLVLKCVDFCYVICSPKIQAQAKSVSISQYHHWKTTKTVFYFTRF